MKMAQKVQISFIDDLDGSEAEGTVSFALDGAYYEIDLNQVHARELRTTLTRYAEAGRKVTGTARRPVSRRGSAATDGHSTTEMRDWARANGFEVKDRGRIPADVVARFQAATRK
jgi:Lsr2